MSDLLNAVLDAYGGLDRWRQFNRVQATIVTGGGLWAIKGQPQDPSTEADDRCVGPRVGVAAPFGADDQKTAFTPGVLRSKSSTAKWFPSGSTRGNHSTGTSSPRRGTRCNARTSTATRCGPTSLRRSCWLWTACRCAKSIRSRITGKPGGACRRSFHPKSQALISSRVLLRRRPPGAPP